MLTIREEDLNSILKNLEQPISGVIGDTNSGKSTSLIHELYKTNNECIIFVVENTVIATTELYGYMHKYVGDDVGYSAENDINYNNSKLDKIRNNPSSTSQKKSTRIVYCTSGHFKNILYDIKKYVNSMISKKIAIEAIDFCHILVLDECHVGTIDYDIIMLLWREILSMGIIVPRLLLISATLDINSTIFPNAPLYNLKSKLYNVVIEYSPIDYELNSVDMLNAIGDVTIDKYYNTLESVPDDETHSILVICPGALEVEVVKKYIQDRIENIEIVAIYAAAVNKPKKLSSITKKGDIIIYICTNIVESSVTIKNLRGEIDGMMEKIVVTSPSDRSILEVDYISKSSAKQRLGRVGREMDAFVYRLCTREKFETFQESRLNEILRAPIHNTIIELLDIHVDPYNLFNDFVKRDVTFLNKINISINMLEKLHLITKVKDKYRVEYMGHFCAILPLSIKCSTILFKLIESKFPIGVAIYMVCILDSYNSSYFVYPTTNRMTYQEYKKYTSDYYDEYFAVYKSSSNFGATLNMWRELFKQYNGNPFIDIKELHRYTEHHSLNYKMIKECLRNIKSVYNILMDFEEQFEIQFGLFNTDNVLEKLIPIIAEVYSDKIFIKSPISRSNNMIYLSNNQEYTLNDNILICKDVEYSNKIIGFRTSEHKNTKTLETKRVIHLEIPYIYTKKETKDRVYDMPDF